MLRNVGLGRLTFSQLRRAFTWLSPVFLGYPDE